MSGKLRTMLIVSSFLVVSAIGLAATAQTRTETLRWQDSVNSDVVGYKIHLGPASRSYSQSLDVGVPPVVSGAFQTSVQVNADADVYFAVTAYDDTAESFYSNERCRGPAGACGSAPPPPPPPPPPPGGAQAAVTGFALWDAETQTRIDSDFQSGEQILLADHACVAIEILGNSYLAASGPGSIKKIFNGVDPGGCSNPGVSHEDSAPFAWEADLGPATFACAESLTQAGSHTLTVMPFDGDSCSGAAGAPRTLTFEVVGAGAPPPPPTPTQELGKPGQPMLVFP